MTALEIIVVVPLLLLAGYLAISDLAANFSRRSRLKRLAEDTRLTRHLQESRRRALRRGILVSIRKPILAHEICRSDRKQF